MGRQARRGWLAILLVAACAPPESAPVTPQLTAPNIRIGLSTPRTSLTLGGAGPLVLRDPEGVAILALPPGSVATVTPAAGGQQLVLGGRVTSAPASLSVFSVDSGAPVRVNGRDYRGSATITAASAGLMAVNVIPVEEYLRGVVGAEMGRRGPEDLAALRAQAVVSRTLALRSLGRWRTRGFDLMATVADQAYAGTGFEGPVSDQAVEETTGKVLSYEGGLIDVFFHSTCAGLTAAGTEVFAAADRPYLRSIRDVDGNGRAWCAISPRYRWRESWSGEALAEALRSTFPTAGGDPALAANLRDIRVLDRTATDRVARLQFVGPAGELTVSGPVARLLLRTRDGSTLRSANFTVQVAREGPRIVELTVTGAGAGHGVGMCQWGALGRSRAGFSYEEILSAYFPGTQLIRTY